MGYGTLTVTVQLFRGQPGLSPQAVQLPNCFGQWHHRKSVTWQNHSGGCRVALQLKIFFCDEAKWKIIPMTQNILYVAQSSPCNERNISCNMKYTDVTRKTSCKKKKKRSVIFFTEGNSCKRKNISCHRKFISCHRSRKEHLMPQDIFPVKERIYLATGNKFPMTGRSKNTLSSVNWSLSDQSCPCLQLWVDYCLDDDTIFFW